MQKFIIIIILLMFQVAQGAGKIVSSLDQVTDGDVLVENPNNISIEENKDGYLVLKQNGNMAILKETTNDLKSLNFDIKLNEHTCHDELLNINCQMNYSVIHKNINFIWVKHADPNKINEIVKLKTEFGYEQIFELDETIFWFDKYDSENNGGMYQSLFKLPKPPTFTCEKKGWLQDIFGNKKDITISEWSTEEMVNNRESGVSMNQVTGSLMGVTGSIANDTLTLDNINFVPQIQDVALISSGVGWTTKKDGKLCDTSFELDLPALINKLDESERGLKYKKLDWNNNYFERFSLISNTSNLIYELKESLKVENIPASIMFLIALGITEEDLEQIDDTESSRTYYKLGLGELK